MASESQTTGDCGCPPHRCIAEEMNDIHQNSVSVCPRSSVTSPPTQTTQATDLEDLAGSVRAFIYWVSANDFTDPDNMLVCAEWFNLCGAVDLPMTMAGTLYRERNPS